MRVITGHVTDGDGVATANLKLAEPVIAKKMTIESLVSGTLNVQIDDDYIVPDSLTVMPSEYNPAADTIKLQRCRIQGLRAVIMRQLNHERDGHPRRRCLELMSEHHLRSALQLQTGDLVKIEIDGDQAWWAAQESPRKSEGT